MMYFSALKRLIGSVEEKLFYDVALIFLRAQGYKDLSIVDGSGDGGRDVVSSRTDLRIQLSVRRDWERKVNDEAALTLTAGRRHLLYITNRVISPDAEADFRAHRYRHAGQVEVTIYELNFISTTLAQAGVIKEAYQTLGISIDHNLTPTPREVAISSVLLFGVEAQELRERIVEAHICATLNDHNQQVSEDSIVEQVSRSLPGANIERAVSAGISRLRADGSITGNRNDIRLSDRRREYIQGAREDFIQAARKDVQSIRVITGLSEVDATRLLGKARELLVRGREFHGDGIFEEDVRSFLAEKGLLSSRQKIYECLSSANTIAQFQFGETINQIFSTNTFDIYRSLGGRTSLTMVLDTSVALPLLLGLEFPAQDSRYGLAVAALDRVCRQHGIKILTPTAYINEMAAHGRKALEYTQIYPVLPEEAKFLLRNSRNAYLSHYSCMHHGRNEISIEDFLAHFGIREGVKLRRIENRITSMLDVHGIVTGFSSWYEKRIRAEIEERKPDELPVIIDHDASVCTNLLQGNDTGFIFATWDNVLIDVVQDLARVFADNPARINDTLSVVEGVNYESEQTHELLFTLLHIDEQAARRLTSKIEQINSVEQAHRFRSFVDTARQRSGPGWTLDEADVLEFFASEK